MAAATFSERPAEMAETAAMPSPAPVVAPLTPSQLALVKATAPVLQQHGVAITTLFYQNMLVAHPELKNIFNHSSQATGAQPRALAAAVLAYATHIEDLGALKAAVERIAHKHVSLEVKPEHYPIVGKYLLEAIGLVLGEAATPEIVDAWTAAYSVLADVFITQEGKMYDENKQDGWQGWRKFQITRREPESSNIESFYLAPVDGGRLPGFLPGQYVSLQVFAPALGHLQSRQYSLSTAPRKDADYYRISVKREEGATAGLPGQISNLLHDQYKEGDVVELTHPQGEFYVDVSDESQEGVPMVLLSAGVGATPVMSILESATQDGAVQRPISWLHASRSRPLQPFAAAVRAIQDRRSGTNDFLSRVFLRDVSAEDQEGVDYDFGGARMDLAKLDGEKHLFLGHPRAQYYVCGPEGFMRDVRNKLVDLGVAKEQIHLELFGTGELD